MSDRVVQVVEGALYSNPVKISWVLHKLRTFVNNKGYVSSSNSNVLESANGVAIHGSIGHGDSCIFVELRRS